MAELFKKQIITEELYLEEGGLIKVIHQPENIASRRYFAHVDNFINAEGPTAKAAVSGLLVGLNKYVSTLERTINSQKNILKESVKNLRDKKAKIEEVKRFLGE
jgi:hypothetical protein